MVRWSGGWMRTVALVVLVVGGLALAACGGAGDYLSAEPGDCVLEGSAANGKEIVDCDDPAAKWTVLGQVDGGGDAPCSAFPDTDIYITQADESASTCLRFNSAEGDCVWQDLSGYSDCEENNGLRLVAILTDAADDAGCPADTLQSRTYSDQVVYCWAQHAA